MIRNRLRELVSIRRQIKPQHSSEHYAPVSAPAGWQHDYYHFKQQLSSLSRKNEQIKYYLNQYQLNPSVFNLQQLDAQIKISCRKIDQIDHWINNFPFSRGSELQLRLERNIVTHFKQSLFKEINKVFGVRQQMAEINASTANREKSFNAFGRSGTVPYNELNSRGSAQRGESFKEVSNRIENLNEILRRMGDVVSSQGDIINRIDENLIDAHGHVKKGRDQLMERAGREQDDDQEEFSCQGKVNKVITSLYLIDVILIIILVLKNL